MWHHLAKAHAHVKRHAGNLLTHLAHEHPILTTALVLAGGTVTVMKLSSTGAPATNVPAKPTSTTATTGGA